jgi:hypothetical protein
MIESLICHFHGGDEIVVLAMDDATARAVGEFGSEQVKVVRVEKLDDAELIAIRKTRAAREFCWTCTPALAHWMVNNSRDGDIVVYLDADLFFFDDPRVLLDELDDDGNVLIHEHRYSSDKVHFEAISGRFNVGLVAFRTGVEARACVARWRAQTLDKCVMDAANGYCGDQGYLNEWPALYPGLRIMRNVGGGVAPWNVNSYRVDHSGETPTVDDHRVVFFHFHALETLIEPRFGFMAVCPSLGYTFPRQTLRVFYRPYARHIRRIDAEMARRGFLIEGDRVRHLLDVMIGLASGRYVSAV